MKMESLLRVQHAGDSPPPRAPRVILYIPPSGRAIHGNDVEAAKRTAELYAASKPGYTVAVYELVGYAYKPITPTEFTSADSPKAEAELLSYDDDEAPESELVNCPAEGIEEPERPDLTPEQRDTMQALRDAMRDEEGV